VYLRWRWSDLEPSPGQYTWDTLDARFDEAVRAGKLVSLSIKAGYKGTPEWVFRRPYSLPELKFMPDSGKPIASPCEDVYVQCYNRMLAAVRDHLRSRSDWYQRLAYIKPTGANRWSAEGVLPWQSDDAARQYQWLEQWATTGNYTPTLLYRFFDEQCTLLHEGFPGKTMAYQLIQGGWPLINDQGQWAGQKGARNIPRFSEQTEHIIDGGATRFGTGWAVQHNGLQSEPDPNPCPSKDRIDPKFHYVGSGCPNRWAQAAYLDHGCPIGYQTAHVTTRGIGPSLRNMWDNSYGMFFESYEDYLVPLLNGEPLPGTRLTMGEWNRALTLRRRVLFPELGDPRSGVHTHMFVLPEGMDRLNIPVMNPGKGTAGLIKIR
jgi:hypothetical protein